MTFRQIVLVLNMQMRLSNTLNSSYVWFVLAGMVLGRYTELAFLILATLFILNRLNKVYVSTSCLFVGALFFFHSLSMVLYNGYDTGKLFQQVVLLFVFVFCYIKFFVIAGFLFLNGFIDI